MKKLFCTASCLLIALIMLLPLSAFALQGGVEVPVLKSVSFNNAELEGEFSGERFDYKIRLDSSQKTPTLKSYEVTQGASLIFKQKSEDGKKGISIEVKKDSIGSTYFFEYDYSNDEPVVNSNNNLLALNCELGEVYPEINSRDTAYSLYIPDDMTQISLEAVSEDVNAVCSLPGIITLSAQQTPVIPVTVTASDGSVKEYTFTVKRLNKSSEQVKQEMQSDDFSSLVNGELFHQKPEFKIIVVCSVAGVLIIIVAVILLKRVTVKTKDDDETEFFELFDGDDNIEQ